MIEASNKSLIDDLQDARVTITNLTAYRSKAIAFETRLNAALRELDDVKQERQTEERRAELAEIRANQLADRCCAFPQNYSPVSSAHTSF